MEMENTGKDIEDFEIWARDPETVGGSPKLIFG